jgi:hypothetical protein
MASRTTLKGHFKTGDKPSAKDFAELIDSVLIQEDDGLSKKSDGPLSVQAFGSDETVLRFLGKAGDSTPTWQLKQLPGGKAGLSIGDATGERLFIASGSGNVGVGTTEPKSPLSVAGGLSVGAGFATTAAPTNGLIVEGNVGIGTPTPRARLEVAGTLTAANNDEALVGLKIAPTFGDNGKTGVKHYGLLVADGNVGIGTTAPDSRLTINSNITHDNNYASYGDAPVTIFEPLHNGGSSPAPMRDILNLVREGLNQQSYGNKVSLAIGRFENSSTNARTQLDIKLTDGSFDQHTAVMSLRSNGNVGIGTGTPITRLHVSRGDTGCQYIALTNVPSNNDAVELLRGAPDHTMLIAGYWNGNFYFYAKEGGAICRAILGKDYQF